MTTCVLASSRISSADSRLPRYTFTFCSRSSWPRRQSSTRPQPASPGRRDSEPRPPAETLARLRNRDLIAAPPERERTLKTGRSRSHDQNRGIAAGGGDALGMPSAAPLLPDGRVLRAAHRDTIVPAGDADVAADAFADVLLAALVDLQRQEGIGDGGSRGADQIEHAAPDLTDHGVRRGEAADPDHGLLGDLPDEVDDRLAPLFRGRTGR